MRIRILSAWFGVALVSISVAQAQRRQFTVTTTTQPGQAPADAAAAGPNNPYGAHLLVGDGLPGTTGRAHVQWARYLVGKWGYAKTLFSGITKETTEPQTGWIDFVNGCYEKQLIPVVRLGGIQQDGKWLAPAPDTPGDYHSMAVAVKAVVEKLPRTNSCPLYIEVWNEPNLPVEWSGRPDPQEYADFFVQVAAAIRSISDPRIRILNGGLATDFDFLERLCKANRQFVSSFDVWASHPYPQNHPPSVSYHDKTAPNGIVQTIDAYVPELAILRRHGRANVKVMITETGYDLGNSMFARDGYPIINEVNRADYMMRAFRDHWSKWPEVLAVMPFEFCSAGWERFNWVYPDSQTTADGRPLHVHSQYTAVAALAKPTEANGVISGTVTIDKLKLPLESARVLVQLQPQGTMTDPLGDFVLPRVAPDKYRLTISKQGFASLEEKVVVTGGANEVLDVALTPERTTSLTGVVRGGDDGKPLEGIKMTLDPGGQKATTDHKGRYEFKSCVPARYTLKAAGRNLISYEATVQVALSKRNQHDFTLGAQRSPTGENVIENAGFESGGGGAAKEGIGLAFEPWPSNDYHEGTVFVSDKFAHTGRLSQEIRMRPRDLTVRQITNYNSARPDVAWTAGAWVRADSPDEKSAAWVSVDATTNDGTVISSFRPREKATGRSNWVWLEFSFTTPPGTQRLSFNLNVQGRSGSAYFDDLHLGTTQASKK